MFSGIKNSWRLARATELKKEVDDIVRRLPSFSESVNRTVALTMIDEFKRVSDQTDNFQNASMEGRKRLAKSLWSKARSTFDMDVGFGTGCALVAAYIESADLPGEEAKYVHGLIYNMIDRATATLLKIAAEKS